MYKLKLLKTKDKTQLLSDLQTIAKPSLAEQSGVFVLRTSNWHNTKLLQSDKSWTTYYAK